MAVDTADVTKLDVEPGTLPEKMAAWVIRPDREGEPKDAFQVEEIEVRQGATVFFGVTMPSWAERRREEEDVLLLPCPLRDNALPSA